MTISAAIKNCLTQTKENDGIEIKQSISMNLIEDIQQIFLSFLLFFFRRQ